MSHHSAKDTPEFTLIPIHHALNYVGDQLTETTLPDPWAASSLEAAESTSTFWQFPLDPKHEIEAAPAPDGILSAADLPTLLRIPAHTTELKSEPALTSVEILLQEELKISATRDKTLWEHVRDGLALLGWSESRRQSSI
ncbi:MAG: hypothetical protein ACTS2F_07310 [Thainema sp.]